MLQGLQAIGFGTTGRQTRRALITSGGEWIMPAARTRVRFDFSAPREDQPRSACFHLRQLGNPALHAEDRLLRTRQRVLWRARKRVLCEPHSAAQAKADTAAEAPEAEIADQGLRRLGAKPDKIIVDVSRGQTQFVKHTLHRGAKRVVMPIDG